ncbi:hypothetical protein CN109_33460 [Sinorhizobium meliloti]|nr:hypothetical protein CN109_33460 [Sinorhizobium meliloti]
MIDFAAGLTFPALQVRPNAKLQLFPAGNFGGDLDNAARRESRSAPIGPAAGFCCRSLLVKDCL